MGFLSMDQVKRDCGRRAANVQHGESSLYFVMSGLVQKVTDPNNARGLACKVHRQPRRTPAEHTGYRVQFPAAAAQVVPGHNKIGSAKRGTCRKQNAILTIPKSMFGRRFYWRDWLNRPHNRDWGWFQCPGLKQRERNLLRQNWAT